MAGIAQNKQKGVTFILVTLLRIENLKEGCKKKKTSYSKYK